MTRPPTARTLVCLCLLAAAARPCPGADAAAAPPWRGLAEVRAALDAPHAAWTDDGLCLSNAATCVRFYHGRRLAHVNGTALWLNATPAGGRAGDADWGLAAADLDLLRLAVVPRADGPRHPLRVLLDPGHGGEDSGAVSRDPPVLEKDLNLAFARRLGARLAAAGLQVLYSRNDDTFLPLEERSRLARVSGVDLLVSVHANFADNADAAGIETYVLPPSGFPGTAEGSRARGWQIGNRNDYHNTRLGFDIHSQLVGLGAAADRGLKRQSFFVLRETSCPAVLVEVGFLSNRDETARLLDPVWQERYAAALAAGVLSYAHQVAALEVALADKRARDAEANERWRARLAAQAAAAASNRVARSAAAPAAAATASSASARADATNAPASTLNSLLEFYAHEHSD